MRRKRKGLALHGWVILDKPEGLSSNQALGRLKRILNPQKAGHAGTLDPLATGVLPIALGEATKTVPFAMDATKEYLFTIEWGAETNTDDREGEVARESDARPSADEVAAMLPRFIGTIGQTPPSYSAIKIDGERAYARARKGEDVVMPTRQVVVHALSLENHEEGVRSELRVICGKGTYVRSLARDIARALGSAGHVGLLRRTRVGRFSIDDAQPLAKWEEIGHTAAAETMILPVSTALDDIPALAVDAREAADLRLGRAIVLVPHRMADWKATPAADAEGPPALVLACCRGEPVALGTVRDGRFQPSRVFQL